MTDWGRLPDTVYQKIQSLEWGNTQNLQKRLTGERPFPINITLKPPTDKQAMADVEHFRQFIQQWQHYPMQDFLEWDTRHYRSLKQQRVPIHLNLSSMQQLLQFLGKSAITRGLRWQQQMQPLLAINQQFYPVLIKHLFTLESLSENSIMLLVKLLHQLAPDMGEQLYLRALPLIGVDTKFVETQSAIITDLLDITYAGDVSTSGGLLRWLGCLENPSGWITVRPLCALSQARLGGFSILQLPVSELRSKELPAKNILVVENQQSGLGLPPLENTIAVFGGGRNVSWMDTPWLADKNLAYWGDIDTWGLTILSEARALAPHLIPLMMGADTFKKFSHLRVSEQKKAVQRPAFLDETEATLFSRLLQNTSDTSRLEQERLPSDFILTECLAWIDSTF